MLLLGIHPTSRCLLWLVPAPLLPTNAMYESQRHPSGAPKLFTANPVGCERLGSQMGDPPYNFGAGTNQSQSTLLSFLPLILPQHDDVFRASYEWTSLIDSSLLGHASCTMHAPDSCNRSIFLYFRVLMVHVMHRRRCGVPKSCETM